MAYYVEPHYNSTACAMIPGYWQPDTYGTDAKMPCATEQEAVELEEKINADFLEAERIHDEHNAKVDAEMDQYWKDFEEDNHGYW